MNAFDWYTARAAGLVSWGLAWASMAWGMGLASTKLIGRKPRPSWLLDLHRYLGGLSVLFLIVHVGGIAIDTEVDIGVAGSVVPYASGWRPGVVAMGILAMYLVVAVELTSLAKRRMPLKIWRRFHYLSYPVFILATAHAVVGGTDMQGANGRLAALIAVASLLGLLPLRLLSNRKPKATGA